MLHLLFIEVVGLLTVYFFDCHYSLLLLRSQRDQWSVLPTQAVPLADDFTQQTEKTALHAACGRFLGFALLGVCQTVFCDVVVFASGQPFAHFPAYFVQQSVQPLAALPHQLYVGRIA